MNWILIIIAGLFEVLFTFCLGKARESSSAEAFLWYAGFIISIFISMGLVLKATQTLPIGTVYAVWTGIGAAGAIIMGIFVFKEPISFWRLFFLTTLIGSIIGLKFIEN